MSTKKRRNLITVRHELGMTQRQAAEELGISQTLYALIESGKRWTDEKADELCERLEQAFPAVEHTPEERDDYQRQMAQLIARFNAGELTA